MEDPGDISWEHYNSPFGTLTLAASPVALTYLGLPNATAHHDRVAAGDAASSSPARTILNAATRQLDEYFAGDRTTFDLPLDPAGTAFQKEAWQALLTIPYGHTISYQEQAQRSGRPKAFRAIGSANGANPIAIIIPCHRVIATNGTLAGYGGGLPLKTALLALESKGNTDV